MNRRSCKGRGRCGWRQWRRLGGQRLHPLRPCRGVERERTPTIVYRGRARDLVHHVVVVVVVHVLLDVGVLHVRVVAVARCAAVLAHGQVVLRAFGAHAVLHDGAVVVGAGVVAQLVARIAPRILQARLFRGALLLDVPQRCLLVRRGGPNAQRGGVFGLLRVVFGGWRRFVLQVERIYPPLASLAHTHSRRSIAPALIMCGRVILAHVQRCAQCLPKSPFSASGAKPRQGAIDARDGGRSAGGGRKGRRKGVGRGHGRESSSSSGGIMRADVFVSRRGSGRGTRRRGRAKCGRGRFTRTQVQVAARVRRERRRRWREASEDGYGDSEGRVSRGGCRETSEA
jgi:hypothetical protein